MKRFFLALSFLTILPAGIKERDITVEDLCASTVYYPMVGAVIGVVLSFAFSWSVVFWPPLVAGALVVTVWVVLTAGLHLDGLMDTFDGLGVRGDLARRLEVMRDSRVGAFGVQAAVLLLLLKTAALAALAGQPRALSVLFLAPVAGRTAMVAFMAVGKYARSGEGLAKVFVEGTERGHMVIAVVLFLLFGTLALGGGLPALVAVQLVLFLMIKKFFRTRFGGVTGDLLGAACEIHELAALLSALVILG